MWVPYSVYQTDAGHFSDIDPTRRVAGNKNFFTAGCNRERQSLPNRIKFSPVNDLKEPWSSMGRDKFNVCWNIMGLVVGNKWNPLSDGGRRKIVKIL